ncbi:hypothetical protein FQZ97_1157130 [compost metagenome]
MITDLLKAGFDIGTVIESFLMHISQLIRFLTLIDHCFHIIIQLLDMTADYFDQVQLCSISIFTQTQIFQPFYICYQVVLIFNCSR